MTQGVTGGYVRHRDRMVQQSVYEDLRDTLIACRWLAGTTSHPVGDPYNNGAWGTVTTQPGQTLPLLEGNPINLIDYFPEAEGQAQAGVPDTAKTPLNTLALDNGTPGESGPLELGNPVSEWVRWRFNLAFYATSDGVAQAVLGDLRDRYRGRLARPDMVELWDFNSAATDPVVRMGVENFTYVANTDQAIAPHQVHLYFGELILEDEVD